MNCENETFSEHLKECGEMMFNIMVNFLFLLLWFFECILAAGTVVLFLFSVFKFSLTLFAVAVGLLIVDFAIFVALTWVWKRCKILNEGMFSV